MINFSLRELKFLEDMYLVILKDLHQQKLKKSFGYREMIRKYNIVTNLSYIWFLRKVFLRIMIQADSYTS